MDKFELVADEANDKALVILQSLLCVLREKNLLTRADIENLCAKVQASVAQNAADAMPCCGAGALAAAAEMGKIGEYIGRRYGGKHRRS
jgi:hypothetical protein